MHQGCHGQIENFEAFSLIYNGEEYKIFVLKHQKTSEASSAKPEIFKDLTILVDNDAIFKGTPLPNKILLTELEGIKADDAVVACAHLDHLVQSLDPDKLYSANEIHSMLFEIKRKQFNLDYELQRNKHFLNEISRIAAKEKIVVDKTLPHDDFSIYGKSQPDATMYRSNGGYCRGSTVTAAAITTTALFEVVGGTVEFKNEEVHNKSENSKPVLQAFANMVRVAGFLLKKALSKGKIIEKINIYGLLISHENIFSVPLRYYIDLSIKSTIFMKGEEIDRNEALAQIMTIL